MDERKNIIESLQPLFKQARDQKLWFRGICGFHDEVLFNPDELEQLQKEGRFIWGPVNWKLEDPYLKLSKMKSRVLEVENEIAEFENRIKASFDTVKQGNR